MVPVFAGEAVHGTRPARPAAFDLSCCRVRPPGPDGYHGPSSFDGAQDDKNFGGSFPIPQPTSPNSSAACPWRACAGCARASWVWAQHSMNTSRSSSQQPLPGHIARRAARAAAGEHARQPPGQFHVVIRPLPARAPVFRSRHQPLVTRRARAPRPSPVPAAGIRPPPGPGGCPWRRRAGGGGSS